MNRIGDNLVSFSGNQEIVASFIDVGVDFVVVGGLAVAWYCSSREADDMDLMLNPTLQNSQKCGEALEKIGCYGFVDDSFSMNGVQACLKSKFYADLLTPPPHFSFDTVLNGHVNGHLFGYPVRIAAIDVLIQLKEAAVAVETAEVGKKHLYDIALLKQVVR
jgi:hypothetical protein